MGEKLEALWVLETPRGWKVFRSRKAGREWRAKHGGGPVLRATWGKA